MFRYLFAIAFLACLILQASALPTISVKGAKFFAGGQQYFLKGVAYQGTPSDPLVDTNQCQLDAKSMQSIGTNSIRVYHVDPNADHDGCMSAFNDAGIYIWLDLDTFDTQIVQATPTWTEEQFGAFAKVMDEFQQYDNLGGFWIGNEVINNLGGSPSAPYIKAAVADMKSYLSAKGYRSIPIGYSAADIAELRPMLQNYLACGEPDEAIDFYGLNSYEWCGAATYENSGYAGLQAMAVGYNLPIFFSETGCNVGGERTFNDQKAIFGPKMIDTWSGSIVYEWVQESNDYGVVDYPDSKIYSGAPIPIQPDFNNLATVWKDIDPVGVSEGSYSSTFSPPACPGASGGWAINGNVPLPRLDSSIIKSIASDSNTDTESFTPKTAPTSSSVESTGMPADLSNPSTVSTSESTTSASPSLVSPSSMSTISSTLVTSSSSIESTSFSIAATTSAAAESSGSSGTFFLPLTHFHPFQSIPSRRPSIGVA
ncbi:Glucanosyltransferase-domain-containing protein [Leptodontidium sp. 2 PMI_412]|nr:Glucanosyltransferase-domain-containing protein [Leptodontidium sp. 2 PMI_412]